MSYKLEKKNYIESLCSKLIKSSVEVLDGVSGKLGKRGSGVIIDKYGYIITNYHVVGDLEFTRPIITLNSNEELIGKVEYKCKEKDIAIIKVNKIFSDDSVVCMDNIDKMRLGNKVIVVGQTRGSGVNDILFGIISGKMKYYKLNAKYNVQCNGYTDEAEETIVLKDLTIINSDTTEKNDGGPIFNINGELIGIHVNNVCDNVSLVMPICTLKEVFKEYLEKEKANNIYLNPYI